MSDGRVGDDRGTASVGRSDVPTPNAIVAELQVLIAPRGPQHVFNGCTVLRSLLPAQEQLPPDAPPAEKRSLGPRLLRKVRQAIDHIPAWAESHPTEPLPEHALEVLRSLYVEDASQNRADRRRSASKVVWPPNGREPEHFGDYAEPQYLLALAKAYLDLHGVPRLNLKDSPTATRTRTVELTTERRAIGVVAPLTYWSTDYYINIVKAIRAAAARESHELQRDLVVIDVPREDAAELERVLSSSVAKTLAGLILINFSLTEEICRDLEVPVVSITNEDTGRIVVANVVHEHSGFRELLDKVVVTRASTTSAVLVTKALANPFRNNEVDHTRLIKRNMFEAAARSRNFEVSGPIALTPDMSHIPLSAGQAVIVEVASYQPFYGSMLYEGLPKDVGELALIFLADSLAIDFLVACRRGGGSAAQQGFRVTGFDNTQASHWYELSTVDYRLDIIGRVAYEQIQLALDFPRLARSTTHEVKSAFIPRESSEW